MWEYPSDYSPREVGRWGFVTQPSVFVTPPLNTQFNAGDNASLECPSHSLCLVLLPLVVAYLVNNNDNPLLLLRRC